MMCDVTCAALSLPSSELRYLAFAGFNQSKLDDVAQECLGMPAADVPTIYFTLRLRFSTVFVKDQDNRLVLCNFFW